MGGLPLPDPPDEPAGGRVCDAWSCRQPSVGWRWFPDVAEWLPCCGRDMRRDGVPERFCAYDDELWEFEPSFRSP